MRRPALGLLVATLAVLASASPAPAREATGAQVRSLASAGAGGDERALESLREVDRVDGRAVDLREALDPDVPGLRSRLRALAEAPADRGWDTAEARREAAAVVREDRFHEPSFPRPLRGGFEWIASTIDPLVQELDDLIDGIVSAVPGGRPIGFALLALAVLLGFAWLSSRTLRLRSRRAGPPAPARSRGPSPAELERAAADAERAGDLNLAVRLRFRAGLLSLDEAGTIRLHPSLTTEAVARRLGSSDFAEVAARFEEVAYGGRAAGADDVEAQRSGWRRVLEHAGR